MTSERRRHDWSLRQFAGSLDDVTTGIPAFDAYIGRLVPLFDQLDAVVYKPIAKCKNQPPDSGAQHRSASKTGDQQGPGRGLGRARSQRRYRASEPHRHRPCPAARRIRSRFRRSAERVIDRAPGSPGSPSTQPTTLTPRVQHPPRIHRAPKCRPGDAGHSSAYSSRSRGQWRRGRAASAPGWAGRTLPLP
jgi:hypothetical protein